MKILVTGAAGFIGAALSERLLDRGDEVTGLDNLNDYYDVNLKRSRLDRLLGCSSFSFVRCDITDAAALVRAFGGGFDCVVHLAAQAGVRYSLENPRAYTDVNITGFLNILEACRAHPPRHLVFASSSSVYGLNTLMPFSVHRGADHPVSLYGATKRANEVMAHAYSHLFGLPATGLRFFTVYGPWGRPDMSLFTFTRKILAGEPIRVFNHGHHSRDFTYIDDIVEGVVRVMDAPPQADPGWQGDAADPATSSAPFRLYNIGNNRPENLLRYIEVLEECLGRKAVMELVPMQPGDVAATWADVSDLVEQFGYAPSTPLETGVARFVAWYLDYYRDTARP